MLNKAANSGSKARLREEISAFLTALMIISLYLSSHFASTKMLLQKDFDHIQSALISDVRHQLFQLTPKIQSDIFDLLIHNIQGKFDSRDPAGLRDHIISNYSIHLVTSKKVLKIEAPS